MIEKKTYFLIVSVIVFALSSIGVFGQESNLALKDKRVTIQMTQKPLYTVFMRLTQKYDIAIGFEESILDRDHQHYLFETNLAPDDLAAKYSSDEEFLPATSRFYEHLITVNYKDARLEDVMDSIVKQMKNYDWEINDDVVNIYPIRGRDERLKELLDVKVQDFELGTGAKGIDVQAALMLFLPEFRKFCSEKNLERLAVSLPGSLALDREIPNEMTFSDLTFKELLNAIAKSKRGGWILQIKTFESKPGKEFITIFI